MWFVPKFSNGHSILRLSTTVCHTVIILTYSLLHSDFPSLSCHIDVNSLQVLIFVLKKIQIQFGLNVEFQGKNTGQVQRSLQQKIKLLNKPYRLLCCSSTLRVGSQCHCSALLFLFFLPLFVWKSLFYVRICLVRCKLNCKCVQAQSALNSLDKDDNSSRRPWNNFNCASW